MDQSRLGLQEVLATERTTHAGGCGLRRTTVMTLREEPDYYADLRRIAATIRAGGDCGCNVVLDDGIIASFSIRVPDPYVERAPKEVK
jgi:hypothetical protein